MLEQCEKNKCLEQAIYLYLLYMHYLYSYRLVDNYKRFYSCNTVLCDVP